MLIIQHPFLCHSSSSFFLILKTSFNIPRTNFEGFTTTICINYPSFLLPLFFEIKHQTTDNQANPEHRYQKIIWYYVGKYDTDTQGDTNLCNRLIWSWLAAFFIIATKHPHFDHHHKKSAYFTICKGADCVRSNSALTHIVLILRKLCSSARHSPAVTAEDPSSRLFVRPVV